MKRPNKIDYLTSEKLDNRFAMFNYYNDLEVYADELEKSIEVMRCCDKLKDSKKISFKKWKKLNCKQETINFYFYKGKSLWDYQLYLIYKEEVENL